MSSRGRTRSEAKLPYAPSWIDRLQDWIERLPLPYWVFYLVSGIAFTALTLTASQTELGASTPTDLLGGAYYAGIVPYGMWLLHYLDRKAGASLVLFRPAMGGSADDYQGLLYRLTHLPARPTAIVSLVFAALSSQSWLLPPGAGGWGSPPPWESLRAFVISVVIALQLMLAGLLLYHTLHQLRTVHVAYVQRAKIRLMNLSPLYAFSTLSAHTAIGIIAMLLPAFVVNSQYLDSRSLVEMGLFALAGVATFVLPLVGIHQRLVREKERRLEQNGGRWEALLQEFYTRLDRGEHRGADGLQRNMAALQSADETIRRIPTWPWRAGTVRELIAALALPTVVWLVQFGLRSVLGS